MYIDQNKVARLRASSSNGICVFTFIFGCLPVAQCDTGKHPNINEYKRKDTDSTGTTAPRFNNRQVEIR